MTPQEKELLTRFLQQLVGAQAGQKDPEADALIKEAVARQPDAAYLLVQRAMQLEHLLNASQTEVQRLQAQASQPGAGSSGGFLSDPNAWGRSAGPATMQAAGVQRPAAAAPAAQAAAPAAASSWGSGLFGNIAATAAGVVAGSFLFQGIQGLMHHGDTPTPPSADHHADHQVDQALANEPELLNSYDTAAGGEYTDSFADSGGSGGGGEFG